MDDWKVLSELNLSQKETYYTSARVTSIGKTALMLDIRVHAFNRPTREGAALHLPEIKWLDKVLKGKGEGTLERPHRKISITKLWYGIRITVDKKFVRQEVCLDEAEISILKNALVELIPRMEAESISMTLPTDFVTGEKIVEKYPM